MFIYIIKKVVFILSKEEKLRNFFALSQLFAVVVQFNSSSRQLNLEVFLERKQQQQKNNSVKRSPLLLLVVVVLGMVGKNKIITRVQ